MRGRPEEIEHALTTLNDSVAAQLSAAGWNRRLLDDDRTDATLTREIHNGVIAVLEIHRTGFRWPDDWPVEIEAVLGVGFEQALNLMPLLTLPPRAALVDGHGPATSVTIELTGPRSVDSAVPQIVEFVNRHASTATRAFPDAAAVDAYLQETIESSLTRADDDHDHDDDDDDPGAADFHIRRRLVLLAAMGRYDETRSLLATYPSDEPIDRGDRRFIRQLERWLDAGGPVAPPVEETLAQLPRATRPPLPSWSETWAKSNAKKEALDAVRAMAKGKDPTELKELIAAEYNGRGIELAPSDVEFTVEMLQTEQQPFGRARNALKALRMLTAGGGDMIRLIKHASDDDPDWIQPPDRAGYPVIADENRYTRVELDAAASDWIERVRTEAPRRMGHRALIDVWLSRDGVEGTLGAHIGERRVGTIDQSDAEEFNAVLQAAALFDEDPFVRGRLTTADALGAVILEIPLPEHPRPAVG